MNYAGSSSSLREFEHVYHLFAQAYNRKILLNIVSALAVPFCVSAYLLPYPCNLKVVKVILDLFKLTLNM